MVRARRRGASAEGRETVAGTETLSDDAVALEEIYLGLRTRDGLAAEHLDAETITAWTAAGWAETVAGRVRLTPEGWLRLDALVASVTT